MSELTKMRHMQRIEEYAKNSAPVEPPLLITPGKVIELFTSQQRLTPQEKRHLGENYQLP